MVSNPDVVRTLERIADLLEIRGENPFKVRAYRQAAVQVENMATPLAELAGEGEEGLRRVAGFGPAIAAKVAELLTTGRLGYLEELEDEIPVSLITVCELPGVGPRTAAMLWRELGVRTIDDLDAIARSGRLEELPRLGARSVEKIVAALDDRRRRGAAVRRPREEAQAVAEGFLERLRALPGTDCAEVAGSLRRGLATVGDLDLLCATEDPQAVLRAFSALPGVASVLLLGATKCSIVADGGLQVDCRAVSPDQFGAAWQYFTGSKAHNVKLRGRALRLRLTLNEYGVFRLEGGERVAGATEEDVYSALGLRWIPPRQREGAEEIEEAALVPVEPVPVEA